MSRVTTAYVSAYQPGRIHESRLFRYEKRRFTADFNAVLGSDTGLSSVDWYCSNPAVTVMVDATCTQKEGGVTVTINVPGHSVLKCSATLTDGSVLTQLFRVISLPSAYFCEPSLSASA
jgi:hypothetical protein